MPRRIAIVLYAGLLIGGFVSSVTAQSPEPARAALRVRSSAQCLEQTAIEGQVRARSQRIAFVAESPDVPLLSVDAQRKTGRSLTVELTVSWPDKRQSRRELAADGCEDATQAIAFLIALTLDPQAAAQPVRGEVAKSAAAPSTTSPPAVADTASTPREAPQSSETAPAAADSPAPAEAPVEAESEDSESGLFDFDYAGFGAGGTLLGGVAPNLMPGLAVHAIVAFRGFGVLVPALQLTAAHAWVNDLSQPGGVADFQRTSVRLDVCPVALQAPILTARACLSAAAGSLDAQGADTYVPRTSSRAWLDLGASLRTSADLGPVFQVVAGLTLAFPLRRDRFAFRPDVFHRVSAPTWEGQLGLGVRFP